MTDGTSIDMAPFFVRHDRVTRATFAAIVAGTLAMSAGSVAYGMLATNVSHPLEVRLWLPMALIPLFVIAFRAAILRWSGKPPMLPDGTLPMNPADARGARRVAHAGAVFVAGIGVALIAGQANIALHYFDILAPSADAAGWIGRTGLAGGGAVIAYFGNAWPRMPVVRAPNRLSAAQKTFNRHYGWIVSVTGVLFVLAALLLPRPALVGTVVILCFALMLAVAAILIQLHRATKRLETL